MARKCLIQKTLKTQKLIDKDAHKRKALRKIEISPDSSGEEQTKAMLDLQKLNVKGSASRLPSRCPKCGRIHAVYKRFNLCRLCIRDFFVKGYLPGVVKSSW